MTEIRDDFDLDPRAFRRALGNFATGVTIITAQSSDGDIVGVTASSFNSLSVDPPLILWSSMKEAKSCPAFESATHFAVNILASDQIDMSNHFARQQEDKFAGIEWEAGIGGAPIFPNCAGRFQCESYEKVDGGDHWIFIGKVITFDDFGRSPLCFHQGSYSMVFSHPGSASNAEEGPAHGATAGRISNHSFFLMLSAVRSYQAKYRPKLETLGLRLIEARSLLVLSDQSGLDANGLVMHVNAPITEVHEALENLIAQQLIVPSGDSYRLTDDGRAMATQCWNLADAHAVEAFKEFSDEQVANFRTVLRGLIEN